MGQPKEMHMKKDQNLNADPKQKKPYTPPRLLSEKVFASDALGGCRITGIADGCGTRREYYLSSV